MEVVVTLELELELDSDELDETSELLEIDDTTELEETLELMADVPDPPQALSDSRMASILTGMSLPMEVVICIN